MVTVFRPDNCPLPDGEPRGVSGLSDSWVEHLSEQSRLRRYIFQAERCPDTGRLHFHFAVQWVSSKSARQLVRTFSRRGWSHPNIGSCRARKKPFIAAWRYASKDVTFVNGSRRSKGEPPRGARKASSVERPPYDGYKWWREQWWQRLVLLLIRSPPPGRAIQWFYERRGNAGKSVLVRHILLTVPGVLIISGFGRDIFSAIADWVAPVSDKGKLLKGRDLRAVIIDIPKASQAQFPAIVVEPVKDMGFLSGKYRARQVLLKHPVWVFVFSNNRPNIDLLSADRWNIFWIGGGPGEEEP